MTLEARRCLVIIRRYAISVDTTNEPLRVVLEFQQRATGPRRFFEQVRELFGEITQNEREFSPAMSFSSRTKRGPTAPALIA